MLINSFPRLCSIGIYLCILGSVWTSYGDKKTLLVIKFLRKVDNTQPSFKNTETKECPKSLILYES
jgi:hypothetical protein